MREFLSRLRDNRNFGEAVGLFLILFGLLVLLSLFSYDAADSSYWFHTAGGPGQNANWFGRVGATLAEAPLQLFGTGAFLLPFGLAVLGWRRLRREHEAAQADDDAEDGSAGPWIRAGTVTALALVLCSLLDLLYGQIGYGGQLHPAGGFIGEKTASSLRHLFNPTGARLVAGTTLLALVTLLTRRSFLHTVRFLTPHTLDGSRRLMARAAGWIADTRERLRRRNEEDEIDISVPRSATQPVPRPESIVVAPEAPAPPAPAARPTPPPSTTPAAPRKIDPPKPRQAVLPLEPTHRGYRLPPIDLLNEPPPQMIESEQELLERARQITDKLQEFAVSGSVVAIHPGPVVTTFEFKPEAGVKYAKITGMTDDLSLALRAESVRIDRMPGRATVAIEVPNRRQETIYPRELLSSDRFRSSPSKLTLTLGKDINGDVFTADLDRMPHLLIAGATGAGKSVGINGMIASLLYKSTPDDVRMIMIDTKMIELGIYADIPHLLIPVVTEAKNASTALKWAVSEMESRYRRLAAVGVRNIAQFNKFFEENPDHTIDDPKGGDPIPLAHLPYIVIIIDELADLMMVSASDVEESIMRLAQMARAVGIHLIIATQRPSVDVITGTIKANFPSRIAFRVSQRVDSRTIIDRQGAEHLLGRGDMLFIPPGSSRLLRVHGGLITEAELNRITAYIKKMADPIYDESILSDGQEGGEGVGEVVRDEMYERAVRTVVQEGKCSITLIQRRLQLGYARAARIVDMMESDGVVGVGEGSKPREILVGPEFVENLARQ